MYAGVFYMGGAYALSRAGHVRADMLYRLWPPRVQAAVEFTLYLFFFFPGILALVIAGWGYGAESTRIREVERQQPGGRADLAAEDDDPVRRGPAGAAGPRRAAALPACACARATWPPRLHDVEELENQILEAGGGAAREKRRRQ